MDRLNPEASKSYSHIDMEKDNTEHDSLLPSSSGPLVSERGVNHSAVKYDRRRLVLSFAGGVLACAAAQYTASFFCDSMPTPTTHFTSPKFSPNVGHFPPSKPTNAYPSLFPTDVGYPGPTPTGVEPGVVATAPAYPQHTGAPGLLLPQKIKGKTSSSFDLFKSWGNLSPWYTVPSSEFGLDGASPAAPDQCRVTGLHVLHRHGARYPTEWSNYAGPATVEGKLRASGNFSAKGELEFLNDWKYSLGAEVLTPFGRHQLYDLGVSMRMRYGFLLNNFTRSETVPTFRTESQDRMLQSAMNFALGFFGNPIEKQYQQLIMVRNPGLPQCSQNWPCGPRALVHEKVDKRLLEGCARRFQKDTSGFEWTIEDVFATQYLCPYETVALGYSKFCELFTQEEWEGFHYALDLGFWYNDVFGSPISLALGAGWVTEMVARLTHTRWRFTTQPTRRCTIHPVPAARFDVRRCDPRDGIHEDSCCDELDQFKDEPLPWTHIPPKRKFQSSQAAPFATNMQIQLLSCASQPEPQLRVINDGVVALDGLDQCPTNKDGLCPLDAFVAAQKASLAKADFDWTCHGEWELPEGPEWNTTTGTPPPRPGA
ncbi:histidine acid phosphatase family [Rhizoctonia solani]|uniref:Histidine acid phosphatase family n=1 Tax=Rhizoctonia solani TaxID=456999 RepID=A0A8H7IBJ0_9AGAM|nr:histidine acid phosphatase family [Rhizoctonia solani]